GLKYYEGIAKENIGKVINNERLINEGESDKLAGESERDAASGHKKAEKATKTPDSIKKEGTVTDELVDMIRKSKL
ncbi:6387_t:CDS:2, partial [Funneliformis mosseae]